MSRVGNKIITLPEGVTIDVKEGNLVTVNGPKGSLTKKFWEKLTIDVNENTVKVSRPDDQKTSKQLHGTTRALLSGMVQGVHEGFKKELEIKGIGYRAQLVGNKVVLNLGYSHPITVEPLEGVTLQVPSQTEIIVSGINKEAVGQMAAVIRSARKPEPYSGKGVMYKGERIRRKVGKKAGKK